MIKIESKEPDQVRGEDLTVNDGWFKWVDGSGIGYITTFLGTEIVVIFGQNARAPYVAQLKHVSGQVVRYDEADVVIKL